MIHKLDTLTVNYVLYLPLFLALIETSNGCPKQATPPTMQVTWTSLRHIVVTLWEINCTGYDWPNPIANVSINSVVHLYTIAELIRHMFKQSINNTNAKHLPIQKCWPWRPSCRKRGHSSIYMLSLRWTWRSSDFQGTACERSSDPTFYSSVFDADIPYKVEMGPGSQ